LKYHVIRLLTGLLLATLVGWWSGYLVLIPALFLIAYLAVQLYNAIRMYRWLKSPDSVSPGNLGAWSCIFDRIATWQEQDAEQRQKHLADIDNFKGMIDAYPDAIMVIDNHENILCINKPAAKLFRLKTPTDRGQAITGLFQDAGFSEWLADQDRTPGKLQMPCPGNSEKTLKISAVRFRKDQRLLIMRDITDVQNLERMRRDLVANVSHELRTPLTVLLGYLEVLDNQPDKPDPKAIKRMYKQARQMQVLLEDLLELSSLQESDSQGSAGEVEVDVPALLAQLEEQAVEICQPDHQLNFDIQPGLNMWGVEANLTSAFQNLIVNAIRYSPEQGSIEVTWKETRDSLTFSVKDNGVGIPKRDIPRITERFYRVGSDRNRRTGGTGLGLAIVKHVLNSHDASLEISSELGEGSEFRCIFPMNRKAD
jgi:two-component system phosphate regulon sensor histidine kinase PhoR